MVYFCHTLYNVQKTHVRRLAIDEHGKEDIPTPAFITEPIKGFFPAMVKSIDNIKVGGEKKLPEEDINILFKNMLGGWLKMLYGVLWQGLLLISDKRYHQPSAKSSKEELNIFTSKMHQLMLNNLRNIRRTDIENHRNPYKETTRINYTIYNMFTQGKI